MSGIGINLIGANRAIIFDACWNPTFDTQAIYRIFRFGQKKPVYVYRFAAAGTLEHKIYRRQVTKQSVSLRVVDKHNIDRYYNQRDLADLYNLEVVKNPPVLPAPTGDPMFTQVWTLYRDLILSYHEHDSLLENRPEESLSSEEQANAMNEEYDVQPDATDPHADDCNFPAPSTSTDGFPTFQSASKFLQNLQQPKQEESESELDSDGKPTEVKVETKEEESDEEVPLKIESDDIECITIDDSDEDEAPMATDDGTAEVKLELDFANDASTDLANADSNLPTEQLSIPIPTIKEKISQMLTSNSFLHFLNTAAEYWPDLKVKIDFESLTENEFTTEEMLQKMEMIISEKENEIKSKVSLCRLSCECF